MSDAEMVAVRLLLLTKVVGRDAPFQSTVEPVTNPVPVTVNVRAVPPGAVAAGTSGFRNGTALVAASLLGIASANTAPHSARARRVIQVFISTPLRELRHVTAHGWW